MNDIPLLYIYIYIYIYCDTMKHSIMDDNI